MVMNIKKKIGVVILAAGSSSRLGRPKQLLMMEGRSLIERVCVEVLSLDTAAVVVVTGAYGEEVKAEIENLPVQVVFNAEWEEGMASSIRLGIEVLSSVQVDAAIILVCDQVKLSSSLLVQLIDAYLSGSCKMAYCKYGQQIGVPALFDKAIFGGLLSLRGERGAKSIIQQHLAEAREILFPGGEADIDRPSDLGLLDE